MPFKKKTGSGLKDPIYQDLTDISDNKIDLGSIKNILGRSSDVIYHPMSVNGLPVTFVYIEGMVDLKSLSEYIIKPLKSIPLDRAKSEDQMLELLENGEIYFPSQQKRTKLGQVINDIISGHAALVFGNSSATYTFEVKGFEKRTITEPTTENVIKGSKEAFIEVLAVNTSLCRRKIRSHNLVIEHTVVGKQTQTKVAILYMNNIVDLSLVEEIRKRLDNISIDRAINPGYIEELINDNVGSPFPTMLFTERPDRFCTNLVEGRVGLIIDGLPVTYILPATLLMFLKAPEDYSQHFLYSSAIRFLRISSFIVTLVLPAFYVSITTFHQEMIPTELAISIASSKEGVPFPMVAEVLAMLIAFELLFEAGLRLPKPIGQAISIVGALIVGQAAVDAKLLSPATIIVISVAATASFAMPNQDLSNAVRLWRFVLVIFGSIIGFYGMALGSIVLLYHLCKMETLGVPYLDPLVGRDHKQLQDTLFRFPLRFLRSRPLSLNTRNTKRQGDN